MKIYGDSSLPCELVSESVTESPVHRGFLCSITGRENDADVHRDTVERIINNVIIFLKSYGGANFREFL